VTITSSRSTHMVISSKMSNRVHTATECSKEASCTCPRDYHLRRKWLSFLPPDSSHPLCPFPNIISLTDTLNGIPMPRQFLIAGHPMYEAVACSTQPGYTVQHMLFVPAALQSFSMNAPRYEVVVCKWYIVPLTDFAGAFPS
jgi:hypothetical protein